MKNAAAAPALTGAKKELHDLTCAIERKLRDYADYHEPLRSARIRREIAGGIAQEVVALRKAAR